MCYDINRKLMKNYYILNFVNEIFVEIIFSFVIKAPMEKYLYFPCDKQK